MNRKLEQLWHMLQLLRSMATGTETIGSTREVTADSSSVKVERLENGWRAHVVNTPGCVKACSTDIMDTMDEALAMLWWRCCRCCLACANTDD